MTHDQQLMSDYLKMKTALEQIVEGPSLQSLGLPVLRSGARERDWLVQERARLAAVQRTAEETLRNLEFCEDASTVP